MPSARAAWISCRILARSQLRAQPLQALATLAAIALGVALAVAVYLINDAALGEFDRATRRLIGDADLIVRGPPSGFDEALFVRLAHDPGVALVSPVIELQLELPHHTAPLPLLALDPFRAGALQSELVAGLEGDVTRLFAHDAIVLSRSAAADLGLRRGDTLRVVAAGGVVALQVVDVMPEAAYPGALGVMDIAAAQWSLGMLGRLDRIDLRLRPGIDAHRWRAALALPPGVQAATPQIERGRAASATRAYRVNLNMLALVALLTGGFLVFSTQSLVVLRRRAALALLRALGVTRAELQRALWYEAGTIGALGALLGVLLGAVLAALVLQYLQSGLGNRQLSALGANLRLPLLPMLAFLLIGTTAACLGAAVPAYEAARRPPALALKAGDAEPMLARLTTTLPGVLLLALGGALAWLPPIDALPLPGYLSIAALLLGAVLLVPALARTALRALPTSGRVELDTGRAQLQGSVGLTTVSLAAIIVSFSLMVAMAIMVHSFRDSFELWLIKLLPADLQLRLPFGSDSSELSLEQQRHIAALAGVARAEFRRVQPLYLRAERAPVSLIARDISPAQAAAVLPLLRTAAGPIPAHDTPVWVSEEFEDLFHYEPGERRTLPLGGRQLPIYVAGVWRDYTHPSGAIVISRADYISATGDEGATEGSLWQRPGTRAAATVAAVRRLLPEGEALDLISTDEMRERSLQIFDRAFAVTYALEAIAVFIGLVGISVAASSTALARRSQFGMLRHLGMLRGQILTMLAGEGIVLGTLGVLYGLVVGGVLSLVLVYVINRQSFHWSIDLAVPWGQLALLSLVLIGASALTALWSGRTAMGPDVIRAVREDW
jgi:putative ABC transport system permease protein